MSSIEITRLIGHGSRPSQSYTQSPVALGTAPGSTLQFDSGWDKGVAPHHAVIELTPRGWVLRDLAGTTLCNGKLAHDPLLIEGTLDVELSAGGVRLRVKAETLAASGGTSTENPAHAPAITLDASAVEPHESFRPLQQAEPKSRVSPSTLVLALTTTGLIAAAVWWMTRSEAVEPKEKAPADDQTVAAGNDPISPNDKSTQSEPPPAMPPDTPAKKPEAPAKTPAVRNPEEVILKSSTILKDKADLVGLVTLTTDSVVVATTENLHVVSSSGAVKNSLKMEGKVWGISKLKSGLLFVNAGTKVHLLNQAGAIVSTAELPKNQSGITYSPTELDDGTIVANAAMNWTHFFTSSGKLINSANYDTFAETSPAPYDANSIITGVARDGEGAFLMISKEGRITNYAKTPRLLKTSGQMLILPNKTIVAPTSAKGLMFLKLGGEIVTSSTDGQLFGTPVLLKDGSIAVMGDNGNLHWFDQSGRHLNSLSLDKNTDCTANIESMADGLMVVQTNYRFSFVSQDRSIRRTFHLMNDYSASFYTIGARVVSNSCVCGVLGYLHRTDEGGYPRIVFLENSP